MRHRESVRQTLLLAALALTAVTRPCGAADLPRWAFGPFVRPAGVNPVITPNKGSVFNCPMRGRPVHWEALHTFNPAAIAWKDKVYVLYRAEDDTGTGIGGHTSRLGLAESSDGIHFTRRPEPVFFPADDSQKEYEWDGGCEDPRLAQAADGTFVLTYTEWNRKIARLAVATSRDLVHWVKHGPAFARAYGGKYLNTWSKSAGILSKMSKGRPVIARIQGKYWMYWGEGAVHLATSTDLVNWAPVEQNGNLLTLLGSRPGKFDSGFPEVGPPPILTKLGILVFYNGKNSDAGDPDLKPGVYSAGQALFATSDPTKLLGRLDQSYFKPEMPFETTGQYAAGTTFTEGLAYFKGKWLLYYGCADSFVGVAVYDPKK